MITIRGIAMSQQQSKKKSAEINLSTSPNFFLTFTDTELVLSFT